MVFVHANFAARASRAGGLRYDCGSSCAADLRRVHQLRETYPLIAVGRRTFERERPQLTARAEHLGRPPLGQPHRLILTRSENFQAPPGYRKVLCPAGDLKAGLKDDIFREADGVTLEAGPVLLTAFLEQGVVSALTIYIRGSEPRVLLPELLRILPALPHSFQVESLSEGYLLTFNLINPKENAAQYRDDFTVTPLMTGFGWATLYTFRDQAFGREHGALVYGDPSPSGGCRPALIRIHSECWTSALMGSLRCDCRQQLEEAHRRIASEGRGVLVLHNAEGRGIGRMNKTAAYRLQEEEGLDTVTANLSLDLPDDAREYFSAAHMLRRLGVGRVRLLTNNKAKMRAICQMGIEVAEQIPLTGFCTPYNLAYLTKKVACGHDPGLLQAADVERAGAAHQQTVRHSTGVTYEER